MPTAHVNGTSIDYDLYGEGNPLLLIHGGLIDRHEWQLQIEPLSKTHQLIIPDVRGHGASGKEGEFSIRLFADDMIALLDPLGIQRAAVCGHSMGGTVAQVLAAEYPQRVTGVILAETNYGTGNDPAMRLAAGITTFVVKLFGVKTVLSMGKRIMMAKDPTMTAALQDSFKANDANPANVKNVVDAMNAFDGTSLLARIQCPALVIIGVDNRLGRKQGEHMAATIPNARLVAIPDAGHGANWDNAPAFNAAVLEFLNGLPAS